MSLVRAGVGGWRTHVPTVPGRPDFFFINERVAIFVDGCFWHGCVKCGHIPKTNRSFWSYKIRRNRSRDKANRAKLSALGVKTIRIWEHSLKDLAGLNETVGMITDMLTSKTVRLQKRKEQNAQAI